MKQSFLPFGIGGTALFFSLWALAFQSAANSTSGAPTIMCLDCHGLPKGAQIKMGNLPQTFKPGAVYNLTLSVESAVKSVGEIQGGFAASASDGELIVADPKTTQKSNGYLTHTAEGALKRSWKFRWQAPKEKKKVILTIAVIAANGDFAPAHDAFARREFVLKPE